MKKEFILYAAAGVLLLSTAVPAQHYFVRNRPFTQVIKSGSEAMVSVEPFLRALDLNWTVNGEVVTLTDKPAANPPLQAGNLKFRFGQQEAILEATPRGGSVYASLNGLAKLTNYTVKVNQASGTVDVLRARFATSEEKQMVGQMSAAQEAERKAREEAWSRKAAELKEKREKASGEGEGEKSEGSETKDKPAPKETASTPTPPQTPPPAAEEKKDEPVKEARLEIFNVVATPDPGTGTVLINGEVKNMGDAPSKPVSGTLILTGPDQSGSATNSVAPKNRVWWTRSLSGPSIQPGASWTISQKYNHPSGNSMPIGNIEAEFKLTSTK